MKVCCTQFRMLKTFNNTLKILYNKTFKILCWHTCIIYILQHFLARHRHIDDNTVYVAWYVFRCHDGRGSDRMVYNERPGE